MSSGKELLLVLNQTRDFFQQSAMLLGTADAMMQKAEWKPQKGSTVTANTSSALYAPRSWMPHYLCRSYVQAGKPAILASIAMILGVFDQDPNEQSLLTEPLISAAAFRYADSAALASWQLEFSTWHLWMPNRCDKGSVCTMDPRVEQPEQGCTASRMSSLAVPLFAISDAKDLQAHIGVPLLALLTSIAAPEASLSSSGSP